MIGAAFSSFGETRELMFLCAVYACWNSLSAVGGSHVPAGVPTSTYVLLEKYGASTASYACANRVALLSVRAPRITRRFGLSTCSAAAQATKPLPITVPTSTWLKLT